MLLLVFAIIRFIFIICALGFILYLWYDHISFWRAFSGRYKSLPCPMCKAKRGARCNVDLHVW